MRFIRDGICVKGVARTGALMVAVGLWERLGCTRKPPKESGRGMTASWGHGLAADCAGGSDAGGEVRVAAGGRSAIDQRSLHAHCHSEFLSSEHDRAKMPEDLKQDTEKTVTSKEDVIRWLKRSLEAVKEAHLKETPQHLALKVHIQDRDSTVDWMYLRILLHDNEHMGQLIAYARMTGVVPPWSK